MKYPVGIQNFEKLREGGFLYIDKTELIHALIHTEGYYFLSRPRRFGKSLLLSTIEYYFKGRHDLFRGLAIEKLTCSWEPHPVLHLDLNNGTFSSPSDLTSLLEFHLSAWEKEYGVREEENQSGLTLSLRFARIIRAAKNKTGKNVVILIDEYDKPLLNAFSNPELAEHYREQLKAFYSNLKTMDGDIRFALLTGVARFSKVSIFSDLNNLRDISFTNQFAAICGVSNTELIRFLDQGIKSLAQELGKSDGDILNMLSENYDGYHFSPKSPDIYNPFSLLYSFANNELGMHWAESGTPQFLVALMQKEEWNIADLAPCEIGRHQLESAGIMSENPIPVLYQTGYLTIKGYDQEFQMYRLDYPNKEVRQSFLEFLVPYYLYPPTRQTPFAIRSFIRDIEAGDVRAFMKRLSTLIAGVPYSEKGSAEAHFQNAVYLVFKLMGFYCHTEWRTSDGRIDLRVETAKYIYIIEFKTDSSSEVAMRQIGNKKYWRADLMSDKEIVLIGANFDTKTRTLDPPAIRTLDPLDR